MESPPPPPPPAALPLESPIDQRRCMAELRAVSEGTVAAARGRATDASDSLRRSLAAVRSLAGVNVAQRNKLDMLKDQLRELESDLMEALSVKTSNASKLAATAESLSIATARVNQTKNIAMNQQKRKDEYSAAISKQLTATEALEARTDHGIAEKESLEEAISWYRNILGFEVTGGGGITFSFNKVDYNNPNKEYLFSIKLENDQYRLLQCIPQLNDSDKLIKELNATNDLFNFVKSMRRKFEAAASSG